MIKTIAHKERFFILFFLVAIIFGFSIKHVSAYTCPVNYFCNTNGGEFPLAWYFTYSDSTRHCSYYAPGYSCTGDSSSCIQSPSLTSRTKYDSQSDCVKDINGSTTNWACCDRLTCSTTCETCTPSIPSGYTSNRSLTTCGGESFSCSNPNNGCGGSCPNSTATYYKLENNVAPSTPMSIKITVDGVTYQLSTIPNAPTKIKLPAKGSTNVTASLPTFTKPATASAIGYKIISSSPSLSYEGASESTTYGLSTASAGLTSSITGSYYTVNTCDSTRKYSSGITGYYVVDTVPITVPPTIEADTTNKGCTSSTYTGLDINNPLHIVAQTSDTNGLDEIQAFILWFSKDTTVPTVGTITASYTGSNNTDFGVMIKKNGATWLNPLVYVTNSSQTWGPVANGGYASVNNTNIVRIYDVSVSTSLTFDYKLEFLNNPNNLSGTYNVYGGAIDSYMINGSTIDQSYFVKFFDWGIDLVNPAVDDLTVEIKDPANTYVTWNTSDATSGIGRVIINGYRVGGTATDTAKLYLPTAYTTLKGAINLTTKPADNLVGMYTSTIPDAWQFSTSGEKDLVNIGNNEGGSIAVYVTAYDKACNTNAVSKDIDLNPWFATRGGSVYSNGSILTYAKDVSASTALDGVFNTTKTAMTKDKLDIGTELLATRNTHISNLIHPTKGAVRTLSTFDENDNKGHWYDILLRKFNKYKDNSISFVKKSTDTKVSDSCSGATCYMYSITDISIPSGYICDKPTLFMSEANINILPDINSGASFSGCIFVAKNNIVIGDGTYKSSGSTVIKYDYLEGYLIADNQIIFSLVDQGEILRDGIEIYGGVIAFGTNSPAGESAISIKRNLKLFSQTNPTVVITYDTKYSSISTIFFGVESQLYKQEVGFKSF